MLVRLITYLLIVLFGFGRKKPTAATVGGSEIAQRDGRKGAIIGYEIPWDSTDGTADESKPVYRDSALDAKSVAMVGRSGCGKSHHLISLIMDDIRARRNVFQIDGTGDAITILLNCLAAEYSPLELEGRLFLTDIGDESMATAANVLGGVGPPMSRTQFMFSVFDHKMPLGVQVGDTLLNTFAALAEAGSTIVDCNRFLSDIDFRALTMRRCTNPEVVAWAERYEHLPNELKISWQTAIANKLSAFTTAEPLRNMFGQTESFPYRRILDDPKQGKIVLVNLAADKYYEASYLAGSLFVSDLLAALLSRADLPEGPEHRIPCRIYIDEAHKILANSPAFERIFTESRRFGGVAIIGTPAAKLLDSMLDIVVGSVSTFYAMQMSAKDAAFFARNTNTDVPFDTIRKVMTRQRVGEAVLIRNGFETVRVKLAHRPYAQSSPAAVQAVREVGQRALGRPAAEVAREIAERYQSRPASSSMPQVEIVRHDRRRGRFKPASERLEAADGD